MGHQASQKVFPFRLPTQVAERFRAAVSHRTDKHPLTSELVQFLEERVASLEKFEPEFSSGDGTCPTSVKVPTELLEAFRRLSKRHGLSLEKQVVDHLKKRVLQLESENNPKLKSVETGPS